MTTRTESLIGLAAIVSGFLLFIAIIGHSDTPKTQPAPVQISQSANPCTTSSTNFTLGPLTPTPTP